MDLSLQIDAVYQRAMSLRQQATQYPSNPDLLDTSLQELHFVLEELQSSQEELRHQNQALIAAQQSIEQERQRYRTLYELAPDGYLVTDRQGKICQANQAAARLFSMPQEYLIDKPLVVLVCEPDRPYFQTRLATLARQDWAQDWELSLNPCDGVMRSVAITVTQILEDREQKSALLWLFRDTTLRQQYIQAEQKIREQAALIDIATDAIFVQDLDHRILSWSKGAERLYGWTAAEAIDQKSDELLYRRSATQPELKAGFNLTLEQGCWRDELTQVTQTDKSIIVASRWTLMRDENDQPQAILVVNTDITETKHLETQIYFAQRMESLGTFASGIAHDLNNVLTPILAISELLPYKFPDTDAVTQDLLVNLADSSRRGAALAKQILSFTDGYGGKRVPLQISHLISEVLQIAQNTISKGIKTSTNFQAHDLQLVSGDTSQLHQVFMNLVINSCDAMPNGGNLTISAENFAIDQNYARMNLEAREGLYVVVTMTDTGTGIPAELRERVFDPFFTTKELGKGTGLGLATVLGIVKHHGGFVRLSSAVGKGSKFTVFLPAIQSGICRPAVGEEISRGNGELILVVDDENTIRQILKTTLESQNYQVLLAKNGVEAIALYTKHLHKIGVAIIDMTMPTLDGAATLQILQKINSEIPMIAVSGLPANQKDALNAGAKTFLAKPFTAREILIPLQNLMLGANQ
jgi:two-component system, cell cycle sensor histidine kinase and response regulator CckA